MAKKWKKAPLALVEHFEKTILGFDQIEPRKMFGYPCAFLNGNMFTGLHEENWVLRLSDQDREEIIEKYQAGIFEPMKGRVMKQYVILPNVILGDSKALKQWVQKSLNFVSSLPVKIAKKKKNK